MAVDVREDDFAGGIALPHLQTEREIRVLRQFEGGSGQRESGFNIVFDQTDGGCLHFILEDKLHCLIGFQLNSLHTWIKDVICGNGDFSGVDSLSF